MELMAAGYSERELDPCLTRLAEKKLITIGRDHLPSIWDRIS